MPARTDNSIDSEIPMSKRALKKQQEKEANMANEIPEELAEDDEFAETQALMDKQKAANERLKPLTEVFGPEAVIPIAKVQDMEMAAYEKLADHLTGIKAIQEQLEHALVSAQLTTRTQAVRIEELEKELASYAKA